MAEVSVSVVAERVGTVIEELNSREDVNLLRGDEMEALVSIGDVLKTTRNVVCDAERRRFAEEYVDDWLSRLERTCHEFDEEVLDELDYALLKPITRDQQSSDADAAPPNCKQKVRPFTRSASCFNFTKFGFCRQSPDLVKKIVKEQRHLISTPDLVKKIWDVKEQLDVLSWGIDRFNFVATAIWRNEVVHTELDKSSPMLKHCFSYCSIFPEDSLIEVDKLIEIWIALGYLGTTAAETSYHDMEFRGREYFNILARHSLFQDFKKTLDGQIKRCKMNSNVRDFAQYQRKRHNVGAKMTTCQVCTPSTVSQVDVYRSLFWDNDSPPTICNCLKSLRVLRMRCKWSSIPEGLENLINLKWLELSGKKLSKEEARTVCKLYKLQFLRFYVQEIPWEIENFVQLTLLDLSFNDSLEELPESICNLHELLTLNISFCRKLSKLPQGIHKLKKLKYLPNVGTSCLKQFPEGVAEMSELRTLNEYCAGVGWSKLGWLKGLRQLRGFLSLKIRLAVDDDLAEVASEADQANLMGKKQIEDLQIIFEDEMGENEVIPNMMRTDIIDALGAPENLQKLTIWFFKGSDLGLCIGWYLEKLTTINLYSFNHLSTLPPLGELSCLEEIYISEMHELKFVGQEFFGYAARWGKNSSVFPRLKELAFNHCPKWEVWEDISEEQAEDVSIMPCLKKLTIAGCPRLKALPHHLLSKLSSSVEVNIICCSTNLQHYSAALWKSTSQQNPHAIASTSQLQQQT